MNIGTDIEEISRFEGKDNAFLERIFSAKEIEYCNSKSNPAEHFCARFCAKEALVKALSDKTIVFKEVEILNDENGKPYIYYKDINAQVSLSHCKNYATATVVVL